MNVNSIIKGLKEETGLPVVQDVYEGAEKSWITYNYADERDANFVDNVATTETAWIQIHYFVPKSTNYFSTKQQIKDYLKGRSFFVTSIQTIYETETKLRHIVFECQITERK